MRAGSARLPPSRRHAWDDPGRVAPSQAHARRRNWVRSAKKSPYGEGFRASARIGGEDGALPKSRPPGFRRDEPPVPARPPIGFVRRGRSEDGSIASLGFLGACVVRPRRGNWVRSAKIARFAARRVRRIEKDRGGGAAPKAARRDPPPSYDQRGTARIFMILEIQRLRRATATGGQHPPGEPMPGVGRGARLALPNPTLRSALRATARRSISESSKSRGPTDRAAETPPFSLSDPRAE